LWRWPTHQGADLMDQEHIDNGEAMEGQEHSKPADGPARAAELLGEILRRMGYDLPVESRLKEDRILLEIGEGGDRVLIGERGETLDALQYLVGRALTHGDGVREPVVVDCGGYRARRKEALRELAAKLGEKALESGRPVALNPLSAHDRRIIHMALRDTPGVSTRSEGGGLFKRVIVEAARE